MKRFLLSVLAVAALALPASAQRLSGNYLDLTSGSMQTPHAADLNAFPLTVTAWVRTTGSAGFKEIVTKYVGASFNGYSVHLINGHVYAWYFVSAGRSVYGGGQGLDGGLINDGAWHHIAYTVDASGGKLYVDGVLKNSLAWTGTPAATTTTTPLSIGRYIDPPPSPTEQVDEVTVWNVARTAAQIDASRTATLVGNEPGLVAYYRCDETSGTAVIDADGGAHPGTIQPGGSRGGPLTGNVIVNSDVRVSNTPGDLDAYRSRSPRGSAPGATAPPPRASSRRRRSRPVPALLATRSICRMAVCMASTARQPAGSWARDAARMGALWPTARGTSSPTPWMRRAGKFTSMAC